ncbi:unnamed protein product [Eruca vesicaria subsp. sativa]|uniref:Uncharacterized protein n=1 Tax=Eruca vesicaria subsp. sativa TaxID=29727 RepID=A0ABC8IRH7_ERUVS|nr:unnamed protein product [Eruca vesicaria subsp. sativa]
MTLLKNEPMQASRGDTQPSRAPESSKSHSQVQDYVLEINQRNNGSFGYQRMNVEDDDCFTVPKFDGLNSLAWIPKMESDAQTERFKDWDEFKQQLLDRFGIVESCSTVEVNGKVESALINATSCETKMVKKLASPTVQEVSGDCFFHCSFSPDLRLKQDSFAHAVQEPEVVLQRDSFHEIDQKTILRGEIAVLEGVEKADSFLVNVSSCCLVNVSSCCLVKGKLTDELISCKESVHGTGAVQKLNSTSREETKEIYIPKAAEPSSFTNLVSSEVSSVMLYPFINAKEEAESIKQFQVFPE